MADPSGEFEHGYVCKQVVELATEYVEGTLSPEQTTAFEMHLNFCDGCYTFIDQIRATESAARRVGEEQIPEELRDKLVAAFRDWGAS